MQYPSTILSDITFTQKVVGRIFTQPSLQRLFLFGILLQFTVYTYFFTKVLYLNHLVPMGFTYYLSWPSFMTWHEGRWLEDIVVFVTGIMGNQPFQMFVASALLTATGILFLMLVDNSYRPGHYLYLALFLLFPYFLDYYCHTAAHIVFALGDFLVILGATLLRRLKYSTFSSVLTIALFVMSMALYQGKIGLIAFVLLVLAFLDFPTEYSSKFLLRLFAILLISGIFYGLTAIMCVGLNNGRMNEINSTPEMLHRLFISWKQFYLYPFIGFELNDINPFWIRESSPYFKAAVRGLCALASLLLLWLGIRNMAQKSGWRAKLLTIFPFAAFVVLTPVALYLPRILFGPLSSSPRGLGANGFYLLFVFMFFARNILFKASALALLLIFFIHANQVNTYTALKSDFEYQTAANVALKIGEIVNRQEKISVVCVGKAPQFAYQLSFPELFSAPMPFFRYWRQTEILRMLFLPYFHIVPPTQEQRAHGLEIAKNFPQYPQKGSIVREGETVYVFFETHGPKLEVTSLY